MVGWPVFDFQPIFHRFVSGSIFGPLSLHLIMHLGRLQNPSWPPFVKICSIFGSKMGAVLVPKLDLRADLVRSPTWKRCKRRKHYYSNARALSTAPKKPIFLVQSRSKNHSRTGPETGPFLEPCFFRVFRSGGRLGPSSKHLIGDFQKNWGPNLEPIFSKNR